MIGVVTGSWLLGQLIGAAAPDAPPGLIDRDAAWPGVLLICVFGLLLMAALVGPLVRANRFEDEGDEDRSHS